MTGQQRAKLINYIDEACRLEDKLAIMKQDIADFYAVAGEDTKVKSALIKKLTKFYREGEELKDADAIKLRDELEREPE